MNLLSVEKLTRSYGERDAFRDLNFGLAKGEKVALVARNGTGKTTLLRTLAGIESPDAGQVVWRTDTKVAYLTQEADMPDHLTVLQAILHADDPVQQAVQRYEWLLQTAPAEGSPAYAEWQTELQQALDKIEQLNAWDLEQMVKTLLERLAVGPIHRKCSQLSGGQRRRAALAKVLLSRPDVLLLDEPTNHLDLDMTEWLEQYLTQSELTLLLVTHDRYFLDRVCTRILELEGGQLFTYEGNYEYFLTKKAERQLSQQSTADKARGRLRTELEWLRRQPKARTTKSKARIDAVAELQEKASSAPVDEKFELNIKMTPIGGKILDIKNVTHRRGEQLILKNFTYSLKRGERIGIVGRNGIGKTTLISLLLNELQPDAGQIDMGETIVVGYYRQDGLQFKPGQRVIDVIRDIAEALPLQEGGIVRAEQFLMYFQFSYAQQQQPVELLSGGERRRLHLLTVLIRNPNLLILDEPTNDLDLVTLQALEEFLLHYKGVLLLVSHDRYFLDRLVDHLWVLPGEGLVQDFNGSYRQWREQQNAAKGEPQVEGATQTNPKDNPTPAQTQTTLSKGKLTYKEQQELATLEQEIARLEARKADLELQLTADSAAADSADHQTLTRLGTELELTQQQLEQSIERWFALQERV